MTTAFADKSGAGFLAGVEPNTGSLAGLRLAWAKYRAYRATLAQLSDLTDRELSDTGMSRNTIKTTAHRAVYGN